MLLFSPHFFFSLEKNLLGLARLWFGGENDKGKLEQIEKTTSILGVEEG